VVAPEGSSRVYFANGDVKWAAPPGAAGRGSPAAVHYFYSEVGKGVCCVRLVPLLCGPKPVLVAVAARPPSTTQLPGTGRKYFLLAVPPRCRQVGTWHSTYDSMPRYGSAGEHEEEREGEMSGPVEVFFFPSGQTEAHHANGAKEIRFPDGLLRVVTADGCGGGGGARSQGGGRAGGHGRKGWVGTGGRAGWAREEGLGGWGRRVSL
jgi:hypothetical protein